MEKQESFYQQFCFPLENLHSFQIKSLPEVLKPSTQHGQEFTLKQSRWKQYTQFVGQIVCPN